MNATFLPTRRGALAALGKGLVLGNGLGFIGFAEEVRAQEPEPSFKLD